MKFSSSRDYDDLVEIGGEFYASGSFAVSMPWDFAHAVAWDVCWSDYLGLLLASFCIGCRFF
jgi:hypothetical protein